MAVGDVWWRTGGHHGPSSQANRLDVTDWWRPKAGGQLMVKVMTSTGAIQRMTAEQLAKTHTRVTVGSQR